MIGSTLSHYRVIERLGSGGMGEVYLAGDTRLGRKVALKVPPANVLGEALQLARFQREARALAAVSHPNVVTIYSVEEHEGLPFLTMEFVEGKTLLAQIPAGGMALEQVLDVAVQLADGLAAAHDQGVLHRDLKPGNIMVRDDGRVTILDFGIAKRLSPSQEMDMSSGEMETLTQEGNIIGTVAYMSPEQLRGQPLDARSDIFSFGVILYQMSTGLPPFWGAHAAEKMLAILAQPARPPSRERSELGPRFDEIVLRCLQKEPQHRYPSVRALRRDLAELRQTPTGIQSGSQEELSLLETTRVETPVWQQASGAGPAATLAGTAAAPRLDRSPTGANLPAPGRRSLRNLLTGAALALLLTSGGWYALQSSRQSAAKAAAALPEGRPAISALAVLPLQSLAGEPEYFADGMTEALISSLGNLGRIRVISRQSVNRYKGSEKPLPVIAKELGVDVVLTGTVTRSGQRLRITAQLVRAQPEQQIWSTILNRDVRDVLALQDEVAREVAQEVRGELTDQEKARLTRSRPVDPAVYDLYLQGQFFWNKRTAEGLRLAVDYFRKAIAADPEYAPAYAALADAYNVLGYRGLEPRDASFQKAREAASRALALDGTLAEAHASLGLVRMYSDWDRPGAEQAYRKAIELNPSYAAAHQRLAMDLKALGRYAEAEKHMRLAQQLNPFSSVIAGNYSDLALEMDDVDRALELARKAIELEPRYEFGHEQLWSALHAKGQWAAAFEELKQTLTLRGHGETARRAAATYSTSGYRAALVTAYKDMAGDLEKGGGGELLPPYLAALVGDREEALAMLARAVDRHNSSVLWMGHDTELRSLRGDPRFEDLLRRIRPRAAAPAPTR